MKQKHTKGSILVAGKNRLAQLSIVPILKKAALHLAVGLAAAALGRVEFTAGVFPFGLAFVIGVSDAFAPAALVGFVLSGLLGGVAMTGSVYMAAVGVVSALRWILAGIGRSSWRRSSYAPCLAAGVMTVVFTDVAVMALSGTFSLDGVLRTIAGACMVCAFSYFYTISFDALRRQRTMPELSSAQKASLALALATLLMSLCPVTVGVLSLGRIVGCATALCAVYLLASPFDMAVLAAVAAAFVLSEPAFAFAAAGVCIAGGLASLFKKRGRTTLCLVFVVGGALLSVSALNYVYMITYISEMMLGALVFLILPVKSAADVKFDKVSDSLASATASVGVKLDCISSSMRDVTALLDNTVDIKDARCNMDKLYSHVCERVCKQCPLMSHCWVKYYGETTDAFSKMTPILTDTGSITKEDLKEPFASRCVSVNAVLREVNRCYKGYLDYIAHIRNTQLYKGMLRRQFSAVATMLDSAKTELCTISEWDEMRSKRIYDCAARLGLPVETASLVYGFSRRPVVTISLADAPDEQLLKRLSAGIAIITGTTLSAPMVETQNGSTVLCFTEQPAFTIQTAASQISADKEACGDVYSVFTDLHGDVHLLLSDGMGTGKDAARDGAICCAFLKRLLESGFPIKQAAELANTALALREDSEAASTLDAASFDVYSGQAQLFKAGAAPTYILHGSRVEKIGGRTLPVGILEYVLCRESAVSLYDGDIVVMASDGVEQSSSPFIEQTLKLMYDSEPEEICREIVARAKSNHTASDDITVIVAKASKR